MSISFKNWFSLEEIAMGTNGQDSLKTQTTKFAADVGQQWLGNKANADAQANIVSGSKNSSNIADELMGAATSAIQGAKSSSAKGTTAPQVATFLGNQLGVKNFKLMRKK